MLKTQILVLHTAVYSRVHESTGITTLSVLYGSLKVQLTFLFANYKLCKDNTNQICSIGFFQTEFMFLFCTVKGKSKLIW